MDSEDHDALNEHEIHIANFSDDGESLDLDTLCTANPLSSWMPRYGRNIVIEVRNSRLSMHLRMMSSVAPSPHPMTRFPGLHADD